MSAFNKEIRFARETALSAGRILMDGLKKKRTVRLKGRVDLVTEIDIKAEKFITGEIARVFPSHAILAEESGENQKTDIHRWVIDPLDGTTNYAHGYPAFCVSMGYEVEGKIVAGVIYNPVLDELFYAVAGKGAFLNRKRIHVSTESVLSKSLLATGFPYDIAETKIDNLDNFAVMYKESRGIRRAGSAALDLCYVACGRFDGFWELKLHPWDTAAGHLFVTEAGGVVTDFNGQHYSIYGGEILASNGRIHTQIQKILLRQRSGKAR